jgi:RimJ/RimL family protein N-acetyltransferase
MSCVDYQSHMAIVMTTRQSGQEQIIAEARYVKSARGEGHGAEFAVVVDDAWQQRGLGRRALRALIDAATLRGLHSLHGDVLSNNQPMLTLVDQCHFLSEPNPEDRGRLCVGISLDAGRLSCHAADMYPPPGQWWPWRRLVPQTVGHFFKGI